MMLPSITFLISTFLRCFYCIAPKLKWYCRSAVMELLSLDYVQKTEIRNILKRRCTAFPRTSHSQLFREIPPKYQEILSSFLLRGHIHKTEYWKFQKFFIFLLLFLLKQILEFYLCITYTVITSTLLEVQVLKIISFFSSAPRTSEGQAFLVCPIFICINLSDVLLPQKKILKLVSFLC